MSILKVADLLQEIAKKEEMAIERQGIKHAPTIGAMYEAMTFDILECAIPSEADINVFQGFVRLADGSLSGQIDCMIVQGEGDKLHNRLDQRIVPLTDVIAVIEVKKSLYSKDLRDSFEHLRQISSASVFEERYRRLYEDAVNGSLRIRVDLLKTRDSLSPEQRAIMSHIAQDVYRPVRIAIGYNGFKSHDTFRSAMLRYLKENIGVHGFGPANFPDIMISGQHCLVKLNGMPYSSRVYEGIWPFLASCSGNPLVQLLEILWTRLVYLHLVPFDIFGEDLYDEIMFVLFEARYIECGNGWEYWPINASEKTLSETDTSTPYEPVFLTAIQFTIISELCVTETISVRDTNLIDYIRRQGIDPQEFVDSLIDTGLVSITEGQLCLLTRECQCAILTDGRFVAGENVSGRFGRWLCKQLGEKSSVLVLRPSSDSSV